MLNKFTIASLLVTALASGCGKSEEPAAAESRTPPAKSAPATAVVTVDPVAKAKEIFATRCTPCHGAEGRGDGAASANLTPKPRNFHDAAWQASVDDEYIAKIVQYGGTAVGKNAAMPANPDLKDQAVIQGLAIVIRELGKNP